MTNFKSISRNLLAIFGSLLLTSAFINAEIKEFLELPDQHREAFLVGTSELANSVRKENNVDTLCYKYACVLDAFFSLRINWNNVEDAEKKTKLMFNSAIYILTSRRKGRLASIKPRNIVDLEKCANEFAVRDLTEAKRREFARNCNKEREFLPAELLNNPPPTAKLIQIETSQPASPTTSQPPSPSPSPAVQQTQPQISLEDALAQSRFPLSPAGSDIEYDASNLVPSPPSSVESYQTAPEPKYALQSDLEILLGTMEEFKAYASANEAKIDEMAKMISAISEVIISIQSHLGME